MPVKETIDARKQRFGADEVMALFGDARYVIAGKGRKSVKFDLKADDLDEAEVVKAVLGPSGNLRAPAVRAGKTWLVGFQADAWGGVFS